MDRHEKYRDRQSAKHKAEKAEARDERREQGRKARGHKRLADQSFNYQLKALSDSVDTQKWKTALEKGIALHNQIEKHLRESNPDRVDALSYALSYGPMREPKRDPMNPEPKPGYRREFRRAIEPRVRCIQGAGPSVELPHADREAEIDFSFSVRIVAVRAERFLSYWASFDYPRGAQRVMVKSTDETEWVAEVDFEVPDRDTGEPIRLTLTKRFHGTYPKARVIRDAMRETLNHELDESIYVNGHRLFDPHRGGRV